MKPLDLHEHQAQVCRSVSILPEGKKQGCMVASKSPHGGGHEACTHPGSGRVVRSSGPSCSMRTNPSARRRPSAAAASCSPGGVGSSTTSPLRARDCQTAVFSLVGLYHR